MSTPDDTRGIKTLAIRLEPEVHAQLTLIAQLKGGTITDELKLAVLRHIEGAKQQADLASRADHALQEIEREAALRRDAIAALFAVHSPSTEPATTGTPNDSNPRTTRSTTRKGRGQSDPSSPSDS